MTHHAPKEWDAAAYHRISTPQQAWGRRVLERLSLRGDERVADAGCGSGRLTAELLERLPRGHVVAIDQSANMMAEARRELAPRYGDRVSFVEADLGGFALDPPVDAIFSTAALHWIHDHLRLFASLHRSLAPGGRLVAQFGGAGNIHRVLTHAGTILAEPEYAPRMRGFSSPYYFATAEETAERLRAAGFVEVQTWLEQAPTPFDTDAAVREFLARVVLRGHLERLSNGALADRFLDRMVEALAADDPPRTLDYVRLNADARRDGARLDAPRPGVWLRRREARMKCRKSTRHGRRDYRQLVLQWQRRHRRNDHHQLVLQRQWRNGHHQLVLQRRRNRGLGRGRCWARRGRWNGEHCVPRAAPRAAAGPLRRRAGARCAQARPGLLLQRGHHPRGPAHGLPRQDRGDAVLDRDDLGVRRRPGDLDQPRRTH